MMQRYRNYQPISYGQFFEQTYPEEMRLALGTTRRVKYSLVHTYEDEGTLHADEYFHLDADLEVIGHHSMAEMMEHTMDLLNESPNNKSWFRETGADTLRSSEP